MENVQVKVLMNGHPVHESIWQTLRGEAEKHLLEEPLLGAFLRHRILECESLEESVSKVLASKLATEVMDSDLLAEMVSEALADSQMIRNAIREDLRAIRQRDPVAKGFLVPFLYFKGFHALTTHRVAHWLWNKDRRLLASHFQSRSSEGFGVDIHPAAKIGSGILFDHATSIVIGETCVVGNNVSMLHEVTLGGTGKESGDRHPKIGEGVLIGAGAKLLGNITIGERAKVGAGSVVLDSVPPHCTVAGVPAKIVACQSTRNPALEMDHRFPHAFDDGGGI